MSELQLELTAVVNVGISLLLTYTPGTRLIERFPWLAGISGRTTHLKAKVRSNLHSEAESFFDRAVSAVPARIVRMAFAAELEKLVGILTMRWWRYTQRERDSAGMCSVILDRAPRDKSMVRGERQRQTLPSIVGN